MNASMPSKSPMADRKRLLIAGILLLFEYLAVSFFFDAKVVAERGGAWALLGYSGNIGPLVVVGVTAFLLSSTHKRHKKAPSEVAGPVAEIASSQRPIDLRWLLLHGLSLGCFLAVTYFAFGVTSPRGPALAWMIAWCFLGVMTGGTLFLGVLSEPYLLRRLLGRVLALGGLVGVLAWTGGMLAAWIWPHLARATFVTVASLLALTRMELLADNSLLILELEGFAVTVAPICSGIEGVGLFAVLAVVFLYRLRSDLRFPQALLLLPLGMVAIWFGNSLRIATLMIVGARISPQLAIGSFHSKAGWVFFCAITLAITALGRNLQFFQKRRAGDSVADGLGTIPSSQLNPVAPLLLPAITWIGVGLITSVFSEGHDPLYFVRVVAAGAVLLAYRKTYVPLLTRPSGIALLVGAAVGIIWLLIPAWFGGLSEAGNIPGAGSPASQLSWIVARCIGAIIVVPVCEELAFRSFLARKLTRSDFLTVPFSRLSLVGVIGSSIAFGAVHEQWLLGTGTGIVYALLLMRRGRMSDPICAHAVSNAVIAGWVLATSSFQHW